MMVRGFLRDTRGMEIEGDEPHQIDIVSLLNPSELRLQSQYQSNVLADHEFGRRLHKSSMARTQKSSQISLSVSVKLT